MALDERGEIFNCKCEGRNPECQTCGGKGYYYQLPDFNKPKEKISNPTDPFPIIIKRPSDADDGNSIIERRIAQYKSQLERKKKNREKFQGHKKKEKEKAEDKLKNEIDALEKELRRKRELLDRELERDAKMLESEKRRNKENFLKELRGENNDEESTK